MSLELGTIGANPAGNYIPGTTYNYLDMVSAHDGSYLSRVHTNNSPLTNLIAWQKVAEKGEPFRFEDFTPEQLATLTGPQGPGYHYQGAVNTYADLPQGLNNTSDVDKAWRVKSDNLIYVWKGSSFPSLGEGIKTAEKDAEVRTALKYFVDDSFLDIDTSTGWTAQIINKNTGVISGNSSNQMLTISTVSRTELRYTGRKNATPYAPDLDVYATITGKTNTGTYVELLPFHLVAPNENAPIETDVIDLTDIVQIYISQPNAQTGEIEVAFPGVVEDAVKKYVDAKIVSPAKGLITVAKDFGDFSSIDAAVQHAKSDGGEFVIQIFPGIYSESIKAKAMTGKISLHGYSKELCIVERTFSDYYQPPMDVSGSIYTEGLTFRSLHSAGVTSPTMYAVHADFAGPGVTEFFNCAFSNDVGQHVIGAGSWPNQVLRLRNCKLIETGPAVSTVAALYWHNNAELNNVQNQRLEIIDCEIYSKNNKGFRIHDASQQYGVTPGSASFMMIGNTLYSEALGVTGIIQRDETTRLPGAFCGSIMPDIRSHGNNIAELNS